jgi:hypothetical protein
MKTLALFFFYYFLFFLLFSGITYTLDWDGYVSNLLAENVNVDFVYGIVSLFALNAGFDFDFIYRIHIFLTSLILSILFATTRDRLSVFFAFLFLVIFLFIPFVNQIRFYMGFSFFWLGTKLFARGKLINTLLFFSLSALCHLSFSLIIPLIFLRSYSFSMAKIILVNLLIFIFIYAFEIRGGDYYKSDELRGSFLGVFYNYSSVLGFHFLFFSLRNRFKAPSNEVHTQFLASIPFYFILPAFYVPIFFDRFVYPFVLFQFLVLIQNFYFLNRQEKLYFYLSLILLFFNVYVLNNILFGFSYLNEVLEMIRSIRFDYLQNL